jgi:hypothetical protein
MQMLFTGKNLIRSILVGVLCLAAATPLLAQTDTARIQGTVTDSTGAAIPQAKITLTNQDTGAVQTGVSTGDGSFTFPALQPGRYLASVLAQGFQSQNEAFSLDVSQVQAVTFKLSPGEVTQSVSVTDAIPLVDTANSSLGTVIEGRQVTELPLNGRNFTQLALLVPGVTRGVYGSAAEGTGGNAETNRNSDTGGAALAVNGLPPQANNFELDGLDNNDAKVNTIVVFPPVEATRQFRVTTSVAPAEFGQAGGAVIQSSIKSGTNSIHGSAFLFDRDQIFDASPNYFAPTQPKSIFHRTQFGGTLGGPVLKNHLFMFGDYQGLRLAQPLGATYTTVPTPLERTGDFSELLTAANTITTATPDHTITGCSTAPGAKGTIYDPTTCLPFPGNKIPFTRLNQAALNYLNAFPLPNNGPAQGNNTLQNNFFTNPVQTQRYDDFDVRLDWNATSKDALFARYSYGQDILAKNSLFTTLPAGFAAGSNPTHPRTQAYGWNHIFSSNLVNEFRYGHLYEFYGYINPFDSVPISANLGIANANRNPLLGGGAAINGGVLTYTGDGGAYTVPQGYNQFVDEVTYSRGKHALKAGVNIEKRNVSYFQGNDAKGLFDFSEASFTGSSQSDMLAGFANNYAIGVASVLFNLHQDKNGIFVQDDWKVSSQLTLNLGVRYDLITMPYEDHNYLSTFDLSSLTLVQAGTNGLSRSILNTNYNNVAPRFGFAYSPYAQNKTVLRGGYGIFYYQVIPNLAFNPDFNGVSTYTSNPTNGGYRINFSGQAPAGDNNNLDANAALPLPIFGEAVNRANPVNLSLQAYGTERQNPTIEQFNLQVQQQLTNNSSLTIAYVGTTLRHQAQTYNVNAQPLNTAPNTKLYPQFSTITRTIANGNSSYNGLQVFLNSRMSHGLMYTAAYTWSHTLDNGGGASTFSGSIPNFAINRGTASSDQRHVFSFSALAELPIGRGKLIGNSMPRALNAVLGGWQTNTVVTLQSGTPFDVTTSQYFYQSPSGTTAAPSGSITERVDQVRPIHYIKTTHEWFDTSAFARPPVVNANGQTSVFTRQGTFGRNMLVGPSNRDMDLSLFKQVPIYREFHGEFRAEVYNLTNTPQFTNPNGSLNSCIYPAGSTATYTCASSPQGSATTNDFGQITSTRVHSERQLQLAFRLQF